MIGVLSLSTTNIENTNCGFNSIEDLKASIELSARLAKQSASKIVFFTDTRGLEIIEEFKEVFDEVNTCFDDLAWVEPYNWGLSKIYAYTFMKEPFFHIDNDAYLWDRLPDEFYDSAKTDMFFQSIEHISSTDYIFYKVGINAVKQLIPRNIMKVNSKYAYNCGLAGFNDLSIIPEYYESAVTLIKRNQGQPEPYQSHQPILFEQWFLANLTQTKKVKFLLDKTLNHQYGTRFTHLLVDNKRNVHNMEQVKYRLAKLKDK